MCIVLYDPIRLSRDKQPAHVTSSRETLSSCQRYLRCSQTVNVRHMHATERPYGASMFVFLEKWYTAFFRRLQAKLSDLQIEILKVQ